VLAEGAAHATERLEILRPLTQLCCVGKDFTEAKRSRFAVIAERLVHLGFTPTLGSYLLVERTGVESQGFRCLPRLGRPTSGQPSSGKAGQWEWVAVLQMIFQPRCRRQKGYRRGKANSRMLIPPKKGGARTKWTVVPSDRSFCRCLCLNKCCN
jgi:hypothetical protein